MLSPALLPALIDPVSPGIPASVSGQLYAPLSYLKAGARTIGWYRHGGSRERP